MADRNALKPNDLLGISNTRPDLFGEPLHAFLRNAAQHLATMTFVGEGLPDAGNRLALGQNKDRHGFPLARVSTSSGRTACNAGGWRNAGKEGFRRRRSARSVGKRKSANAHFGRNDHGPLSADRSRQQLRADP